MNRVLRAGEISLEELRQRARAGSAADVDWILSRVGCGAPHIARAMIRYALGLVDNDEGRARIRDHVRDGAGIAAGIVNEGEGVL